MQKIKLVVMMAALAMAGYGLLRSHETKKADRAVDAFFADFKTSFDQATQRHLSQIDQDQGQVHRILERQSDAIRNYSYANLTPMLDIWLSNAVVPVSWHLTIKMKNGNEGWKISSLDEFISENK